MYPVLQRLRYALDPSHGTGFADRFKTLGLLALCGLVVYVEKQTLFDVPEWAFLTLLGTTALSLGVDLGFHEGRFEETD